MTTRDEMMEWVLLALRDLGGRGWPRMFLNISGNTMKMSFASPVICSTRGSMTSAGLRRSFVTAGYSRLSPAAGTSRGNSHEGRLRGALPNMAVQITSNSRAQSIRGTIWRRAFLPRRQR